MKDKISRFFAKQISKKTFVPILPDSFKNLEHLLSTAHCLELDISVPYLAIQTEIQAIPSELFVPHRDKEESNIGWKSFVLHGKSFDATREQEYYNDDRPMSWTREAITYCPQTVKFFQQEWPSTDFDRVRVMLLEPKSIINVHADPRSNNGIWAVNIAITQPNDCNFYLDNFGIVPFSPGSVFVINVGNKHTVINDSNERRYHMIVHHKKINKKFDKIIERSYNNYNASKIIN